MGQAPRALPGSRPGCVCGQTAVLCRLFVAVLDSLCGQHPAWLGLEHRGAGLEDVSPVRHSGIHQSEQPTQLLNWVPACVFLPSVTVCLLNNVATRGSLNSIYLPVQPWQQPGGDAGLAVRCAARLWVSLAQPCPCHRSLRAWPLL